MNAPEVLFTDPAGNRARIGKWADFVYFRRGGVTHVKPFTSQDAYPEALCGRSPSWAEAWLGTGSQDGTVVTQRKRGTTLVVRLPR